MSELTDETELLLLCARGELTESQRCQLAALVRKNLDWNWLLSTAKRHCILPLIWSHLAPHCDQLPSRSLDAVRRNLRGNAASCLRMTNELLNLSQLLADNHIPMIAFKGPVLSLALYGKCYQRQYGDLDLFIPKEDLQRTTSLLQSVGYRLDLTPAQTRYFLRRRYHFAFVHEATNMNVEVHWAFTPQYWPFPLDFQHLWSKASDVDFLDHRIRCLSAEHRLLVLCAHGSKERWSRLQLVSDVHAVVNQGVAWEKVLSEAADIGRQRVLFLGLALASDLLGTKLPREVSCQIDQDKTVGHLVNSIRGSLFDRSCWPLKGAKLHSYFFRVWPRSRDRIGYLRDSLRHLPAKIAQLATPGPRDRRLLSIPLRLYFLYYLIRPLRLAWHYRSPRRILAALLNYF